MKIKRNDLCPCGSGKKYKKCCINLGDKAFIREKPVTVSPTNDRLLKKEDIAKMSTTAIIARLDSMNIPFDEATFQKDMKKYYSAEDISENWFDIYDVQAVGREEDFPWLAACVLWERLAPSNHLSLEQIDDLRMAAETHFKQFSYEESCDKLLLAWDGLKKRFNPMYVNLDFTEEQYKGAFSVRTLCSELEIYLYNASLQSKKYAEKRIAYSMEFCRYFPNDDKDLIIRMKNAIAESHHILGNLDEARNRFEKLIEQYPDYAAGYIGKGDVQKKRKQYSEALSSYKKGLTNVTYAQEVEVLQERINQLKELVETE